MGRAPHRVARRIGIFGGTFDPPHVGHLALAEWARVRLRLDEVLFVPSARPPHKAGRRMSAAEHRVRMTRLAVRGNPAFRVSTLEVRRSGPSFTVDTLAAIARANPGARLYLLLGEDSLRDFPTWRDPAGIRKLAAIAVAGRPGVTARAPAAAGRVRWLENPGIAISSTELRARARAGHSLRYLVPDAVERYIATHRLYGRRA